MCPDFRMFQYSSQAKIPIHHGARTDQKCRIDKKQAYYLLYSLINSIFKSSRYSRLYVTSRWRASLRYAVKIRPGTYKKKRSKSWNFNQ